MSGGAMLGETERSPALRRRLGISCTVYGLPCLRWGELCTVVWPMPTLTNEVRSKTDGQGLLN